METTALATRLRRLRLDRAVAVPAAALVAVQALILLAYYARPDVVPSLFPVYPFVWIDVALLALATTTPPAGSRRRRLVAAVVAAGYFLVLAYFGGLVAAGAGTAPLQVNWSLPVGYSPMLFYDGAVFLAVMPYELVGYLALAFLVYVTILDAAGAALSGVVGLFSCVSCTWPVLGTVAASVFGGTSQLTAAVYRLSPGLSTLVFVSAVALLWWRPTVGRGGDG